MKSLNETFDFIIHLIVLFRRGSEPVRHGREIRDIRTCPEYGSGGGQVAALYPTVLTSLLYLPYLVVQLCCTRLFTLWLYITVVCYYLCVTVARCMILLYNTVRYYFILLIYISVVQYSFTLLLFKAVFYSVVLFFVSFLCLCPEL